MTFYLNNGSISARSILRVIYSQETAKKTSYVNTLKPITGVYIKFILNRVLNNISRLHNFFFLYDIRFRLVSS